MVAPLPLLGISIPSTFFCCHRVHEQYGKSIRNGRERGGLLAKGEEQERWEGREEEEKGFLFNLNLAPSPFLKVLLGMVWYSGLEGARFHEDPFPPFSTASPPRVTVQPFQIMTYCL